MIIAVLFILFLLLYWYSLLLVFHYDCYIIIVLLLFWFIILFIVIYLITDWYHVVLIWYQRYYSMDVIYRIVFNSTENTVFVVIDWLIYLLLWYRMMLLLWRCYLPHLLVVTVYLFNYSIYSDCCSHLLCVSIRDDSEWIQGLLTDHWLWPGCCLFNCDYVFCLPIGYCWIPWTCIAIYCDIYS